MALFQPDDAFSTSPFMPAGTPLPKPIQAALPSVTPGAQPTAPAPVAPKLIQPVQPEQSDWNQMLQSFLETARAHESGGNDTVVNATTGATGRYQFLPSTWEGVIKAHPELGLRPEDIRDGDKQDLAYRAFVTDNAKVLRANGLPVNEPNLFMLSFMGSGGGPAFLKAVQQNPGAIASSFYPKEAAANPTVFHDPSGQPRTLAQVYQFMTKSFGGGGSVAASQNPATNVQVAQGPSTVASDATMEPPPAPAPEPNEPSIAARKGVGITPLNVKPPTLTPEQLKEFGVTPTPPTLTPEQLKEFGVESAGDYTDAQGVYHPKIEAPKAETAEVPQIIAMSPDGNPIYADPALNDANARQQTEFTKGLASGVAQDVTGLGEHLTGVPGLSGVADASARWTKFLQGVGDPNAQIVGSLAPMAIPFGGEAPAVARGLEAIWEGGPVLANTVRAMLSGARAVAPGAMMESTGEEDPHKRAVKLDQATARDLTGGVVSAGTVTAAGPIASKAAGWVWKEISSLPGDVMKAIGKEAAHAAEELQTGTSIETGRRLTEQQLKASGAAAAEGLRRAEQTTAEQTAAKVAEDFSKFPTLHSDQFGKQLQETAEADAEALKDARATLSGYKQAAEADGGKPSVPTKQFIATVNEAEKNAVSAPMKSMLSDLKTSLRTQGDGGNPTVTAISIQRARRIIQDLDRRIDGLPGDERAEMTKLKDAFVAHLETVHPDLAKARARYAELSRPLDIYRDSGPLAKAILEDPYSGKNIVDTTKVVGALLNKTEGSADALGRLIQAKPELKEAARQFFTQRLADMAKAGEAPSYANYARLLKDQRLALDRAGLTKDFEALAEKQKAAEEGLNTAKTSTQQKINELASAKTDAAAKANTLEKFKNQIDAIDSKLIKDVPATAKSIANGMMSAKVIDAATHAHMLREIEAVDVKYADEAAARKKIRNILIVVAGAAGIPFVRHTLPMSTGGH